LGQNLYVIYILKHRKHFTFSTLLNT